MGSHSVTCHPTAVTFPPLPQMKLVLDLATPEGCKAEFTSVVVTSQDSLPDLRNTVTYLRNNQAVKGKVLPYSLPSIGPEAVPGVQSVSPRWLFKSSPAVCCHHFPAGLRSPSQPTNVTILQPVPSYTAFYRGKYAALPPVRIEPTT